MSVKITEVLDTRVQAPEPGRQQQTIEAAEKAQPSIDGCKCVVLFAFIPNSESETGFTVEVGVGGTGPVGFGKIVGRTLHGVADVLDAAMTRQENQRGPSS